MAYETIDGGQRTIGFRADVSGSDHYGFEIESMHSENAIANDEWGVVGITTFGHVVVAETVWRLDGEVDVCIASACPKWTVTLLEEICIGDGTVDPNAQAGNLEPVRQG